MKITIVLLTIVVVILVGELVFNRKRIATQESRLVRAQHAIREASKPDSRPVIVGDDYPPILIYKELVPRLQTEDQSIFIVALPSFEVKLHIPGSNVKIIENVVIGNVVTKKRR